MTEPQERRAEWYLLLETPFGSCGIAWNARGLTRLQLPEPTPAETERRLALYGRRAWTGPLTDEIAAVVDELGAYFSGRPTKFSGVAIDFGDRPQFHLDVYAAARRIPWGETVTYGDLARLLGVPGAARVVGQAMGRNPVPVIMPCHRVLASGNALHGFSAPGGIATKQRLLELERANAIERLPLFAPRD
ncbi:MAG: methylated-DNA--[protein]-cysteine S-methyltransferase [Hyphomicrobiaceae bacterium]